MYVNLSIHSLEYTGNFIYKETEPYMKLLNFFGLNFLTLEGFNHSLVTSPSSKEDISKDNL